MRETDVLKERSRPFQPGLHKCPEAIRVPLASTEV